MSAGTAMASPTPHEAAIGNQQPSTPPLNATSSSSQQTLVSTEEPGSPVEPAAALKTEPNDDRLTDSQSRIIPSSLTPPPSSQAPHTAGGTSAGHPLGYVSSQRANIFSPPMTTTNDAATCRDSVATTLEYMPPSSEQIADADIEQLRAMFQSCLAENARQKMETAHHKLQYNLLSMQAEEDAKRAAVEHDMIRREVDALRMAEDGRQARRELSAAAESTHAKYMHLKGCYENLVEDNDVLRRRLKVAKKVIQQKEDEIVSLTDERDMLLTRIRENREHFHMLCSPGGAFHGALTPKMSTIATPLQPARATPRQTPKSARKDSQHQAADQSQAGFAALLQALSHDNNSAPSTPISGHRPTPRVPSKHTRGVQSLSSLPTTPNGRPRGEYSSLLPSVDLVPHSEPPARHGHGHNAVVVPHTPTPKRARKSRESTISADDNETLARAALESVAAATQSYMSQGSRSSRRGLDEEDVYESQASQAASEMLRRDPQESFEIASSIGGSRDATPPPAEKSVKLQSRLFAGVNKPGMASEKRKHGNEVEGPRRDLQSSPPKKMRYGSDGRIEGEVDVRRIGLGIRY